MTNRVQKSLIAGLFFVLTAGRAAPQAAGPVTLKVYPEALHAGRITPFFYGNFIELLDDVIPGMWAEMLGNRGFEGVEPTAIGTRVRIGPWTRKNRSTPCAPPACPGMFLGRRSSGRIFSLIVPERRGGGPGDFRRIPMMSAAAEPNRVVLLTILTSPEP